MITLRSLFMLLLFKPILGLDNGVALTPPMGWLTWQRYRCITDCKTRPEECISENLITTTADLLVSEGYLEAGYEYVGIDDCWPEMERDEDQKLVPDKTRFPNGMKYIGDYLHNKGLKFGIYEDFGTYTCAGYPGSLNHMEIDTETFGEWDVDYVKLDGCYVDLDLMDDGYPLFGALLNKTGRPMLYSCSWPVYQEVNGIMPNFSSIMEHCNLWRNWYDIDDSWSSIDFIMNYFGNNSRRLATYAGPGHWNDPDMLIIGNFGLSFDQSKVQMSIWSILAAPLLISADLARMKPEFKDIILNKDFIAINQDILGRAGIRVAEKRKTYAWKREITPLKNNVPSLALAFVNHNTDGTPRVSTFTFKELEMDNNNYYTIEEIMPSSTQMWRLDYDKANDMYSFTVMVNPTGVLTLKLTIKETDTRNHNY